MIRVLHVLCDLSGGGAERLVVDLCRHRSADIEAQVATVQGSGPLEAPLRELGIAVRVGGRRPGTLGLRALERLVRVAREVDVVHTHLFAGDTWGRLAGALAGRPRLLTTEHNVNRDETWQRHVKRALAPLGRVVAVSEAAAAYSRAVDRVAVHAVIPNGVDLARFGPHRGGDGSRVIFVGRPAPQKGLDVLLAALPGGMTLTVVGDGAPRDPDRRVRWLGRREDVPALLAEHDVLAVPSRWEGFGLVAAEGLAAGIPVLASAVDGLVEVVGDAGWLLPPGDVPAWRAALTRVATDAALRAGLSAAGPPRARERFDLKRTVDRYEAIYRELSRP